LRLKSKEELANLMFRLHMSQFEPGEALNIVSEPYRTSWEDVLDEWSRSFDEIDQQSLTDVYLDHGMDYRVQRRARVRLDSARWFSLPIYPYMDERVYSAYRSLPLDHLLGERAHIGLLSSYKLGLEKVPSAQRRFAGLPISAEYRYRNIIHLGRVVRQKLIVPLKTKSTVIKGLLGLGKSSLSLARAEALRRLQSCDLFNWPEVNKVIGRAERGVFVNVNALNRLINAHVLDDFLFRSASSKEAGLHFLKSPRDISFVENDCGEQSRTKILVRL
jgi:hypothetical protein